MNAILTAVILFSSFFACIPSDPPVEGKSDDLFSRFRFFESFFADSPVHLAGDSIIHLGEEYFEAEDWYPSGISGEETWHLKTRLNTVVNGNPDFVIIHIGANDILAGRSPDEVFNDIKEIVKTLKNQLPEKTRIGWLEINPLGDPGDVLEVPESSLTDILSAQTEKNQKLYILCKQVEGWHEVEFIKTRPYLEDKDKFIFPKYGLGDMKHVNRKAYREVYVPVIRKWLESQ